MEQLIQCDNCNETFNIKKLQRRVLKGLIYQYYFTCPDCEHEHIAYYTDQRLRRDIKRQDKRWEKYRQAPTEEMKRRLMVQINTHKKLMKKDMDTLENKMKTLT